MSAGLLDEPEDHAQPQTRALANLLRRKEWFENLAHHLLRNTTARVGDNNHHILSRFDIRLRGDVIVIENGICGLYGQAATFGHGVAGIHGKVQKGRFELRSVRLDLP